MEVTPATHKTAAQCIDQFKNAIDTVLREPTLELSYEQLYKQVYECHIYGCRARSQREEFLTTCLSYLEKVLRLQTLHKIISVKDICLYFIRHESRAQPIFDAAIKSSSDTLTKRCLKCILENEVDVSQELIDQITDRIK